MPCFEFEPVDIGARRVGGDADESFVDAVAIGIDAHRAGDLYVLVIAQEPGKAHIQPVVEQRGFPAQFVTVDRFRLEAQEFELVVEVAVAVTVQVGGGTGLAARVEPAALEAARVGEIDVVVFVGLEADRATRGELLKRIAAQEIAGHCERHRGGRREQVGEATDKGGAQHPAGALVAGVAATEREAELFGDIIGEIAEDRPGPGLHIAQCLRVEARQTDQIAGGEQRHVESGEGIGIEVIEAEHTVEPVAFVKKLQLLAELIVFIDRGHVEIGCRQTVKIDRRGGFVLAISGGRPEPDFFPRYTTAGLSLLSSADGLSLAQLN